MNILISGAASGIGLAVCKKLTSLGHSVYALDVKSVEKMQGVESFEVDVCDGASLGAIAERLLASGVTLDAIILAAGVHDMASLVETDFARIERLIGINLVGTMRVAHAFHQLLSPRGRFVIVTSEVATYTPMPFNGLYNVSKTALECYADALRQELNLIGQRVVTVRPGAVETPLAKGSANSTERLALETKLYKNEAKHFSGIVKKFTGVPMKAEKMAKLIVKAALVRRPHLSYSKHRNPGLVLLSLLPRRVQCAVIKLLLKR